MTCRNGSSAQSAIEDHVIVACLITSGHRLMYVRLVADEALQRSARVTLVLGAGAPNCPEFEMHLSPIAQRVSVLELGDHSAAALSRVSDELSATLTVVTDGDEVARQLARPSVWRAHGLINVLVMRPNGQAGSRQVRAVETIAKRTIRLVAGIQGRVRVFYLTSAVRSRAPKGAIRDPIRFAATSADILEARLRVLEGDDRYWFAVVGALTARKNLDKICAALALGFDRAIGLVVAGQADSTVPDLNRNLNLAAAAGVKVKRIEGVISDVELDAIIGAADCVVIAHSNEGPSGILGKAASAGTRTVLSGAASLRLDAASLGDRTEWTSLSVPDLHSAMMRASRSASPAPMPLDFTSFAKGLLGVTR